MGSEFIIGALIMGAATIGATAMQKSPDIPDQIQSMETPEAPEELDPLEIGGDDDESVRRKRQAAKSKFKIDNTAQAVSGVTLGESEKPKQTVPGVQL